MKLSEFIKSKPKELRLGQWFVNCYWKGSDENSQLLYQLDNYFAEAFIVNLMQMWQWEELPEVKENK